jgi:hypothetical protein
MPLYELWCQYIDSLRKNCRYLVGGGLLLKERICYKVFKLCRPNVFTDRLLRADFNGALVKGNWIVFPKAKNILHVYVFCR